MARIRDLLVQFGTSPTITPMIAFDRSFDDAALSQSGRAKASFSAPPLASSFVVANTPNGALTAFGGHAIEGRGLRFRLH